MKIIELDKMASETISNVSGIDFPSNISMSFQYKKRIVQKKSCTNKYGFTAVHGSDKT